MSDFFTDTMKGLLEAVAIEKGEIDMTFVPNMPGETYRSSLVDISCNENVNLKFQEH